VRGVDTAIREESVAKRSFAGGMGMPNSRIILLGSIPFASETAIDLESVKLQTCAASIRPFARRASPSEVNAAESPAVRLATIMPPQTSFAGGMGMPNSRIILLGSIPFASETAIDLERSTL
jgi:hypothetical protein